MNTTMSTPVYCRPQAFAAFARECPQLETTQGLFRAAFAIALHDRSEALLCETEAILVNLAETIRRRVHSPSVEAKLAHLHDVLFDIVGLHGNVEDYYNPANSYLPDVLRARRGLPITLVLIYKCVAEAIGLTVYGINAPGHFLAAVESSDPPHSTKSSKPWMYVDPFYGGELLDEHEVYRRIADTTGQPVLHLSTCLARATNRQWLTRMLVNLQATFASVGRERDVLAMQELQLLLDK